MRQSKWVNDVFTNLFAAYPVFSSVSKYRDSHKRHHGYLGTNLDPDYIRHMALDLSLADRNHFDRFLLHIFRRLHIYVPSWWVAIGTDFFVFLKGFAWHLIFLSLLGLILQLDTLDLALIWLGAFFVPFFFALPLLRFVGESNEHDYSEYGAVIVRTFTNPRIIHKALFHPHNDGYHTLHHILPAIPFFNLAKAHEKLKSLDKNGYGDTLRERVHILTEL